MEQNQESEGILKVQQPETSKSSSARYFANKHDVLSVVGFSLYLAWVFLILLDALNVNVYSGEHAIGIVPFYFLGQIIAAAILWFFSKILSRRGVTLGIAIMTFILLPLPGVASLGIAAFEPILPFIWTIAGFGGLFLLALWGIFLSGLNHKNAVLYPPLSVLAQSLIVLTVLYFFRSEMISLALIFIPMLSTAFFLVWWFSALKERRVHFFTNTRPPDVLALLRSAIAMVANNFLIGFVLYSVSVSHTAITGLIVIVAIVCAAGYKTYDAMHHQRFEVRQIIKVLAPTAAVGLLLLPYISIELRILCLALMMFIAMLDEAVCWSAVSEYMHVYQLIPFANMAFGRLGDTVGCFLGYICAFFVFGTSLESEINTPIILSIVVILFVIIQIYFFRDNYSPFTEHSTADKDSEADLPSIQRAGHWKERCEQFAEYHQLTPRQRDTLIPFAKGYSTKYIESVLFVSSHTVKAHIYNIYRKTGVHTRQELIEAIESFDWENPEH